MGEAVTALPCKPATAIVQISEAGEPWLRGYRCAACAAVVADATLCCRACGSRVAPGAVRLSTRGKLFTWAMVYRSFPGVAVPFVSAIVDFDDGLTVKGTLRAPDLQMLHAGMPVVAVFDDAGGARDAEGAAYLGYHFEPAGGEAA